jgi:hypothetical protein
MVILHGHEMFILHEAKTMQTEGEFKILEALKKFRPMK